MRSNESVMCRASNSGKRNSERGFTLIETSVALVVLMVAGLGVASLFTYSIRYNSGADDRAIAISIAQAQLEQFRSVAFTDPVLNVSAATVLNPNTVSNGRTYQVTKTVTGSNNDVSGNPTLKTVTIRVDPLSPGWAGFPVIVRTVRSSLSTGPN
ncbi:MAG: prepilin-type N-terminal cleavage/methylation domain-containing protein [Pyrinomonadaceae bacterium]